MFLFCPLVSFKIVLKLVQLTDIGTGKRRRRIKRKKKVKVVPVRTIAKGGDLHSNEKREKNRKEERTLGDAIEGERERERENHSGKEKEDPIHRVTQ